MAWPPAFSEWRQLIVSVLGRCGTVYMVPRAVFPILHCESSSGQPRGARTACVLLLAAGAEWAFFLIRNQVVYYTRTPSEGGHSAHVRHVRVELAVAERRLPSDSQRGVEG